MSDDKLRILAFGAHPDDCDLKTGGVACLYADRGHDVRFVSVTDGRAGHHEHSGAALVERRRAEATAAADVAGIKFTLLDNPDGRFQPSLSTRNQLIRLVRKYNPNLVLTHRPNDYHPDHRYTAQLVRDAAYMVTVPNVCPGTPALRHNPVFAYFSDGFKRPYPFSPDVVVDIDDAVDRKFEMLHCHESQVYEWLAYNEGILDEVPENQDDRLAWLQAGGLPHTEALSAVADRFRDRLTERYGDTGNGIEFAEAFEISEYGGSTSNVDSLFPFA